MVSPLKNARNAAQPQCAAGCSGTTILPPTRKGTYTARRPCGVGHRDRLRHVIGIVSTVLSGLKSQPGAVAVKVLGPHRIGQLSECLYCPKLRTDRERNQVTVIWFRRGTNVAMSS